MRKNKKKLFSIAIILIIVIISVTQVKRLKFLFEIIKLSNSLPTISSNFYNEPIKDITYKDIVYKKRGNKEIKLDIYTNREAKEAHQ